MRRLLLGVTASAFVMLALAPAVVATTPSTTTFAGIVAWSKLVVLAGIDHRPDGGYIFRVERVLKGTAPDQLVYPPLASTPPLDGWSRAVIAFANPETDDFRAPTIAWDVAGDGSIDSEGFQRYPGLPLTLVAMLRYFELPSTDTAAVVVPVPKGAADAAPIVLVVVALTGLLLASRPSRRRARF